MRMILVRRKLLAGIGCLIAAGLMLLVVSHPSVVGAAATERQLPIYCVQKDYKVVSLSFDAAWGNEDTQQLIDILGKYNVKATFFVTGRGDDELILREYNEGHTVGLHTFSHDYAYVYSSVENYFNDLSQVATRVKNITGVDAKIIRFPGGASNTVSTKYDGGIRIMSILTAEVLNRGYVYFDWNVSSNDAGSAHTADAVYNSTVTHLKDGVNVVLQHDIKNFSVNAVEEVIQWGLAQGYTFKALDMTSPTCHHGINN